MRQRKRGFFGDRRRLIAVAVVGALLLAGILLLIRKIKATPGKYPRKAGTPSKEPLH